MRYPFRAALTVGIALAQIGEFSFILATIGRDLGILTKEATNVARCHVDRVDHLESGRLPSDPTDRALAWRSAAPLGASQSDVCSSFRPDGFRYSRVRPIRAIAPS